MMKPMGILLSTALVAQSAELPVRQVVLYKHGIGFFERAGKLASGENARLEFKASEMNDVLKSLTIVDKAGGKVSGLRYDSQEPLDRKLAEFPFKLGNGQSLAAALDQVKGARLELKTGQQSVAGAIVSGRVVAAGDNRPERELLTLLTDAGDLTVVDLATAASVKFSDAKLQQQFRDYLAALTAARTQDKRAVYIDSAGAGAREIVATYTIPAAVWKSSYRLMLGDAKPTLEGWAIVDNTTGEDWNGITLALVSGRPISFVSQLYPPRYVNRPSAELADEVAQAPVVHGGVIGGIAPAVAAAPAPMAKTMMRAEANFAAPMMAAAQRSSIDVDTVAREAGDLFEYRLSQPVTIRKNESAMLPFLQQPIEARKLLIYSNHSSPHPTNAAELSNSSGKTLDGGPVTVYDGGSYAGEALMDTLKSGDKRLVSYAVDLGTRISENWDTKAEVVREVHASNGVLTTRTAANEVRTYSIKNIDAKAKTLIIEHPARPEYTLLNQKAAEKTANAYRFEVKLQPSAETSFAVNEERVYETTVAVTDLTPPDILIYARNKSLTAEGRRQLEQIVNVKGQIADTDRDLKDARDQISAIASDQDRLRRNIQSLNNVGGQQQQVQQYATALATQESQLAKLRDRELELTRKRAALQAEVEKLIRTLSF